MRRRRRALIAKIRALTARDWAELLESQLALARAQLLVFTRPTGGLIDGNFRNDATAANRADTVDTARRLGVSLSRAARYGVFRPQCLVRSLALQHMLERRGIEGSRIRIGVRRDGQELLAHAWVEYGGQVLGDHEYHVASFTELAAVKVKTT